MFLDHPVEDKVVLVSHAIEEILEELSKVADIRLLFKLEASTVIHVDSELLWVTLG